MLSKPSKTPIAPVEGEMYMFLEDYQVDFAKMLAPLQFVITKGTITDLASVPWYFRWLIDRYDLGDVAPPIHDVLCESQGKFVTEDGTVIQLSWFDVHLFFLVAMRLDGISPTKALLAFLAVLLRNRPIWK